MTLQSESGQFDLHDNKKVKKADRTADFRMYQQLIPLLSDTCESPGCSHHHSPSLPASLFDPIPSSRLV